MGPAKGLFFDAGVALLCLSLSAWCYSYRRQRNKKSAQYRGYILENSVTHARLLPVEASHAFTYPTLALLVSVDALEGHELDLWNGFLFGYGGRWGRLTGLRSNPYFAEVAKGKGDSPRTLREKLDGLLIKREFIRKDGNTAISDCWMLTMPSCLGFEGINPLTVYFCYDSAETLWLVILEIHNTFGETHVHVLAVDKNEDPAESRPRGFDHQWTFQREFHVSPFNDRSGFYTISVKSPSHPPTLTSSPSDPPRPAVRIHLHTPDSSSHIESPGPLKLTALLRPTASYPLTTPNLLWSLSRMPFALLLTLYRILAQAWVLHYRKRLDVFIRPEPLPPPQKTGFAGIRRGGGVKWLGEGLIERYARMRALAFLKHRVDDLGLRITLVSADPSVPDYTLSPREIGGPHLAITYLTPRFFTILFTAPSAEHVLLSGSDTDRIFSVSSRELFISVFSATSTLDINRSSLQHLRADHIQTCIPLTVPAHHPLDPQASSSRIEYAKAQLALRTLFFLEQFERWIFSVAHARIVAGQEPWTVWDRAERVLMERRAVEKEHGEDG